MNQEKNIDCPKCKVDLVWTKTDKPNIRQGVCPNCGMTFTDMNGAIIGGVKINGKSINMKDFKQE